MSSANPGLAYDNTPPFSAPLRFLLTAPLFGIAAGLVLLLDPSALASRWTPGALAAVHLIATGVMLQAMLGALMQILPVVAGAPLPVPRGIATATHLLITAGSLGLSWGLWQGQPPLTLGGAALLGIGLATFLAAAMLALLRAPAPPGQGRTPRDLRLALAGLAVTAALGLLLATALATGAALPVALPDLVNLHAGWGWMGWGGVLLASASWVIVPMFHITPAYPKPVVQSWTPAVFAALLLWSAVMASPWQGARLALISLLCVLALAFALTTLHLQSRTRRSTPDASFLNFRAAMLAIVAGTLATAVAIVVDHEAAPVIAGVLILHGGFVGAISAMLYKIVPFLAWLHLVQAGIKAPNVKKLSPDLPVRRQLRAHSASLAALLAAALWTPLAPIAAMAIVIEFAWLLVNLSRVVNAWRRAGGQWQQGPRKKVQNTV
ncbi:MAG: hypothetical protein J0M28_15625 [Thauera sp.]|nr:hypothetical protein [Thauera sp.]